MKINIFLKIEKYFENQKMFMNTTPPFFNFIYAVQILLGSVYKQKSPSKKGSIPLKSSSIFATVTKT